MFFCTVTRNHVRGSQPRESSPRLHPRRSLVQLSLLLIIRLTARIPYASTVTPPYVDVHATPVQPTSIWGLVA